MNVLASGEKIKTSSENYNISRIYQRTFNTDPSFVTSRRKSETRGYFRSGRKRFYRGEQQELVVKHEGVKGTFLRVGIGF